MTSFDLHEPRSLGETFELLERYGEEAHVLAGGTALVLLMRSGLLLPEHVVSLQHVPGMREIGITSDGGLEIGALVTHREIERSALVKRFFAPLAETFGRVATVRIRNQGTIGGNLVHADPAGDPPPMLMALDAEVAIASNGGIRTVAVGEFFQGLFETVLGPGEIVTSVRIPPPAPQTCGTYVKFLPASKDDYATVSVAATLLRDSAGACERVRIALGAVALTPVRARRAEAVLSGKTLTPERISEAAAAVLEEIDPQTDIRGSAAYKKEMARVWTERALAAF
ncbi:MAG: FAD binding domain-containing protein [Vulcanimicrobiaceae bacterium]